MEDLLKSIGLDAWVPVFRDQGITAADLADLTEEDLRELGMTIGERKRFRRAVLARDPRTGGDGKVAPVRPVLEATRAERRPMTVLFADLVNSTGIAERLEPEDLLEVIRQYREVCGIAIMHYGGHIARLIGDGVLAYFCYPVANENDPERSVRAALDIVRQVSAVTTPMGSPLAARVGIATGQVIVSDLFAGGGDDRQFVIGSTPNLASRLQALAQPGGIVIADETHDRVAPHFTFDDLGARVIRGFEEPHHAWLVVGVMQPPARAYPRRRTDRLTPFFGREAELAILAEHWQRARQGDGGVVTITGQAGIGKSRLVETFVLLHVDETALVVRLAASALNQDSPLHPVIAFMHATAGLNPDDTADVQLAKIRDILGGDSAAQDKVLPLLAELLGIPGAAPAADAATPQVLRVRLLLALVEHLLMLANNRPLCILFEDLHWLDPTSAELLQLLVERIAGRPILLLLTARDGLDIPLAKERGGTTLPLAPLSADEVAGMVQSLFTQHLSLARLGSMFAEKTDGVPLFVEEVARSLLHLSNQTDFESLFEAPLRAIPASLRETLMARLDRSGPAKQVAQIAAVVGRSIRHDVLAEVADIETADLERSLASLADSGLLVSETSAGGQTYTFGHALIRDTAYDSLLREDRQRLHLRVARALQKIDPQWIVRQPELLALHLTEGGEFREAAAHWLNAARRSLTRSALTEATRLLQRGVAALGKAPATPDIHELLVQFYTLLGPALIALKGPASTEAQELYGEAYSLCKKLPESASQFPIYWGWWRVIRDISVKQLRADVLLDRANTRNDPEWLLQAHHCNWATHYDLGDFGRCCEHIGAGLKIYDQGDFRHHGHLYGNHDPKVCALGALAQVHWMQGRPASGLRQEEQAISLAHRLEHLGSRVHSMDTQLLHRCERREHRMVLRLADELVSFTSEHGMSDHRAKGLIFRGWAVAMHDDPAAGMRIAEEGLARQRDIGTLEDFPIYICLLAEAMGRAGQHARAAEQLLDAKAQFEAHGLQFWMPEVLRSLADATLAADRNAIAPAHKWLTDGAELAAAQGVPMLGLRIAVSAARLDMRLEGPDVALRRLETALTRVAEAEDCTDIVEARQLAHELRAKPGTSSQVGARWSG